MKVTSYHWMTDKNETVQLRTRVAGWLCYILVSNFSFQVCIDAV